MIEQKIKRLKVGSEKYGTAVMKDEEVEIFFEAALGNCDGDGVEAFADMKMVDTLFHIKRLHFAMGKNITHTATGYFRKGSELYAAYESVIHGRMNGKFTDQ